MALLLKNQSSQFFEMIIKYFSWACFNFSALKRPPLIFLESGDSNQEAVCENTSGLGTSDLDGSDYNLITQEISSSFDNKRLLMDWMYVAPEDSASHLGQHTLGFYVGDKYKIAADAKCTLLRMCAKLEAEDKSLRTFRRKLGFSQIAHKDLAPIIVESATEESWEVFSATVK